MCCQILKRIEMLFKVDSNIILSHIELEANDRCYFLKQYTPNVGFQGSNDNDDILNFKKCPSLKDQDQYKYKNRAILKFARYISEAFERHPHVLNSYSWIPIPPSKAKSDPKYDDRMVRLLNQVEILEKQNIVELIYTQHSHVPSHSSDVRHSKEYLKSKFAIDHLQVTNCKKNIVLIDDVLTNGTHFKACCELILEVIPDASIIGLFLARRIIT